MLTVSVAVMNPDREMFHKFIVSLKLYTPELSQLLIVDNGTDIGWKDSLDSVFGNGHGVDICITTPGKNLGFGRAHNENAKLATGYYFAVLNDDIEFFETWSTPMIEALQDDTVAQVGMKRDVCNSLTPRAEGTWNDTDSPEYIEASCMMMRTDIAREYGPFDDAYKLAYYEDSDLSLRLRKDGFQLKSVDLKWKHYRAKTSGNIVEDIKGYHLRNAATFKSRWSGYLYSKKFIDLIIVKRTGSYGDVFLVEPVIAALKKQQDCLIGIMSSYPEVIIESPDISGIANLCEPVFCQRIIDLDYAYEKDFRKHIIDAYAEVAGVTPDRKHAMLYLNELDEQRVNRIMDGDRDFVVLELSNTWKEKQWDSKNYKELIALLKADGHRVYGVGVTDKYTGDLGLDKNYLNIFSPMETAAFMKRAKMFIGHEGLLGHFAQALNIPHLILYGCTSPEYVSDTSLETWHGVVSPVGCQGCRHVHAAGCMVICKRKSECMKAITVEMVYAEYERMHGKLNSILCTG